MVSNSVSPRVGYGPTIQSGNAYNADVTSNGLEGLAWQGLRSMSPVHAQSLSPPLRPRFKPIGQEGAMILAITYRAVADLKPYPRNPRTHSRKKLKQIAAAIKEFGFTNPILIDETDQIIARKGRV